MCPLMHFMTWKEPLYRGKVGSIKGIILVSCDRLISFMLTNKNTKPSKIIQESC
jgi:hypothetical protein